MWYIDYLENKLNYLTADTTDINYYVSVIGNMQNTANTTGVPNIVNG